MKSNLTQLRCSYPTSVKQRQQHVSDQFYSFIWWTMSRCEETVQTHCYMQSCQWQCFALRLLCGTTWIQSLPCRHLYFMSHENVNQWSRANFSSMHVHDKMNRSWSSVIHRRCYKQNTFEYAKHRGLSHTITSRFSVSVSWLEPKGGGCFALSLPRCINNCVITCWINKHKLRGNLVSLLTYSISAWWILWLDKPDELSYHWHIHSLAAFLVPSSSMLWMDDDIWQAHFYQASSLGVYADEGWLLKPRPPAVRLAQRLIWSHLILHSSKLFILLKAICR